MPHTNTIKDFWLKVNKTGTCWNWIAAKDKNGYGCFIFHTKKLYAHRFSWKVTFGEIPKGLLVCHKCDNPSCVKPLHLFLGTHLDNGRDKAIKNRAARFFGETNPMSKLTKKNVLNIRKKYQTGDFTQSYLGELFGVRQDQISRLVNNLQWKHS